MHVLAVAQFDDAMLRELFEVALKMKLVVASQVAAVCGTFQPASL